MRKYIFLSYSIMNIGGAQIYLRNKLLYLRKLGFEVEIFSFQRGELLIKELDEFIDNIVEELQYPVNFYNKHQINSILERILLKNFNYKNDIIIESNSIVLATWGELVANKLKCKNFVYLLAEKNKLGKNYLNFLKFKHKRRELAGIHKNVLFNLFLPYKLLEEHESYALRAYANTVIEDYSHSILNEISKADFTIGSIGRLEKPYLNPLLDNLIIYLKNYPLKLFNIVLIGGAPDEKVLNLIKDKFRTLHNAKLIITGYIFPIPKKLFHLIDVFVSTAGSAALSKEMGIPTISIDTLSHKPIGILGFTTSNAMFKEDEDQINLNQLLDQILIDQLYPRTKEHYSYAIPDYSSHLSFVEISTQSSEYYFVQEISLSVKLKMKGTFISLFGFKMYKKLVALKNYFSLKLNIS